MTRLCLIAAVAENGVIGRGNALPWRIPSELKYFKRTTKGHPVIMGRKSFESLPAALPARTNIVVTRQAGYDAAGAVVAGSLDAAIALARDIARRDGVDNIFICGGADIYRQALPLCDALYLTEIHARPDGDTFFPAFDRADWVETFREAPAAAAGETAAYSLTVLERKN